MVRRPVSLIVPLLLAAGFLMVSGMCAPAVSAAEPAEGDTLRLYHLGEILVTAPAPGVIAEPGRTEIPGATFEARDAASAEGIAPLVPATRVGVNSRGEALFILRGASERQIGLYYDGVPLNIPWDERVDLSFVPAEAVGAIRVIRGGSSALEGPNTLAGVIHLVSRDLDRDGRLTQLTLQGGEVKSARGHLLQIVRRGDWSFLGSLNHRNRSAFLLPARFEGGRNQPATRSRLNSDLRVSSLLLRLTRRFPGRGELAFSAGGTEAEKGVPPEIHRGEEARFWRIPTWRRSLWSVQGERLWGEDGRTRLNGSLSLDLLRQVIQQYPDSTYAAPLDTLAAGRESGRDVTGTARMRLTRRIGRLSRLSGAFTVRIGRHRETPAGSAIEQTYTQRLGSAALEWEGPLTRGWTFRAGAGLDRSDTPATGGMPSPGPLVEPVVDLRLTRRITERAQLHIKAGRRSRFPSLRELYSGALGKFEPNPDLAPETLETVELGGGIRGRKAEIAVDLFAHRLRDGIVKVVLPSGKFQRRNEESIRTLGVEVAGTLRPAAGIRIDAHHTFLHARAKEEDAYRGEVEGPAAAISYLSIGGKLSLGPPAAGFVKVLIEGLFAGRRWSLDANTGELVALAPSAIGNLRFAWILPRSGRRRSDVELYVRLNNLTDRVVYSQLGLPEAGRELLGGMRIEF